MVLTSLDVLIKLHIATAIYFLVMRGNTFLCRGKVTRSDTAIS